MRIGECRRARTGQPYCKGKDGRVKFKALDGLGMPVMTGGAGSFMMPGFAGGGKSSKRRGRKMKVGECRRTRNGVKYCKGKKGVRFRRG